MLGGAECAASSVSNNWSTSARSPRVGIPAITGARASESWRCPALVTRESGRHRVSARPCGAPLQLETDAGTQGQAVLAPPNLGSLSSRQHCGHGARTSWRRRMGARHGAGRRMCPVRDRLPGHHRCADLGPLIASNWQRSRGRSRTVVARTSSPRIWPHSAKVLVAGDDRAVAFTASTRWCEPRLELPLAAG